MPSPHATNRPTWEVWPGAPCPLGATWDGHGVNFAVYSEAATHAYVCLFDAAEPSKEQARLSLGNQTNHVFHGYVPHLRPGALYGFRFDGPGRLSGATGSTCTSWSSTPTRGPSPESPTGRTPWFPIAWKTARRCSTAVCDRGAQGHRAARRLRLGGRPSPRGHLASRRLLRAPRQGLHRPPPACAPGAAGDVRGPYASGGARSLASVGGDQPRAAPGFRVGARGVSPREETDQLLGLQHVGLLRPRSALLFLGYSRRASARVQGDGEGAPRGGARGDPRRRLQPQL